VTTVAKSQATTRVILHKGSASAVRSPETRLAELGFHNSVGNDFETWCSADDQVRAQQHLDVRLALGQTPLDIYLQRAHELTPYAKKAGGRPLSVLLPAPAHRHESCQSSIASAQPHVGG